MVAGKTTVQISIETRNRLMELGKKGDSYDDIIRRLLEAVGAKSGQEAARGLSSESRSAKKAGK